MGSQPRQPSSPDRATESAEVASLWARIQALEGELAVARSQNDELRRQWSAWLALVSHDLRGPLTLILGYAQSIARRLPTGVADDRARRELDSIVGGARRVDKMIGQIVDAARLDAGLLAIERRDVDLVPLLQEEVRRAKRLYSEHVFQIKTPDTLAPILADPRRVSQIIATLLSNAALYSPSRPMVDVTADSDGDRVVVVVRDQGLGLDTSERRHLFDRGFHSDRSRDVRREGLGLSLSIARELSHALGGELWVESAGPNRGASFFVAFPLLPKDFIVEE